MVFFPNFLLSVFFFLRLSFSFVHANINFLFSFPFSFNKLASDRDKFNFQIYFDYQKKAFQGLDFNNNNNT